MGRSRSRSPSKSRKKKHKHDRRNSREREKRHKRQRYSRSPSPSSSRGKSYSSKKYSEEDKDHTHNQRNAISSRDDSEPMNLKDFSRYLDRMFFRDADLIPRGSKQYADFWKFYEKIQQKKLQKGQTCLKQNEAAVEGDSEECIKGIYFPKVRAKKHTVPFTLKDTSIDDYIINLYPGEHFSCNSILVVYMNITKPLYGMICYRGSRVCQGSYTSGNAGGIFTDNYILLGLFAKRKISKA